MKVESYLKQSRVCFALKQSLFRVVPPIPYHLSDDIYESFLRHFTPIDDFGKGRRCHRKG